MILATREKADLNARMLVMSSHLYYDRSVHVLPDSEYDRLSEVVADALEAGWLDEFRAWQVGPADRLRATGMGIKLTMLSVCSAADWYRHSTGETLPSDGYVFRGVWSDRWQLHWSRVSG